MVQLGIPHDVLLGRWRLTLDLFGRVFVDDVGAEPGSIISELGGFPVKETKFRREMERLRTSKTVDLTLHKLDRDRNQLIVQVNKECFFIFLSTYKTNLNTFDINVLKSFKNEEKNDFL